MDALMSRAFAGRYADLMTSDADIDIGGGWLGVAETLIKELNALHPGLRVGAMFRDGQGMLQVDVAFGPGDYDSDILDRILDITASARLLSAWVCQVDGRPGWLVDSYDGRRPLCPHCQQRRGLKGVQHEA